MRKHRLYGVVIAVLLLGTTPFKQRPSSPHHLLPESDTDRSGLQLTAAELPADQTDIAASAALPALLSDDPAPPPTGGPALDANAFNDQSGRTIEALWSWNDAQRATVVTPVATPPPAAVTPARAAATPAVRPATPPPPAPHPATAAAQHVVFAGTPGVWAELRRCESNGNYADNTGNGYYGAYQFSAGTWHGLGLSGLPSQAPPSVQDQAAQRLQARSGWGQWPSCARVLGLR